MRPYLNPVEVLSKGPELCIWLQYNILCSFPIASNDNRVKHSSKMPRSASKHVRRRDKGMPTSVNSNYLGSNYRVISVRALGFDG